MSVSHTISLVIPMHFMNYEHQHWWMSQREVPSKIMASAFNLNLELWKFSFMSLLGPLHFGNHDLSRTTVVNERHPPLSQECGGSSDGSFRPSNSIPNIITTLNFTGGICPLILPSTIFSICMVSTFPHWLLLISDLSCKYDRLVRC